MALTGSARRAARPSGWAVAAVVVALLLVAPLLALPASFIGESDAFGQISGTLLPDALRTSIWLALGVGVGTLALGGGLALLVSFYDFPGRRVLDWALVLPLALPGYVLVFVVLGQFGTATPFQSTLFGDGLRIPGIRTTTGAVVILTAVLGEISDGDAALREIRRVLKPDGRLVVGELFGDPHFTTRASLERYTKSYLREVWSVSIAIVIMSYSLWAFE